MSRDAVHPGVDDLQLLDVVDGEVVDVDDLLARLSVAGTAHDGEGEGAAASAKKETAAGSSEATALKAVQSLGAVIGPTALLTGLLFYFGWARAQSQADYLGLDVSLFGFSTQDYVLQSISSVYVALGEVLIAALLLLWAHRVVVAKLRDRPDLSLWPWAELALGVAGAVLFVLGLVGHRDRTPSDTTLLLTPLFLTFGIGSVSYAVLVHRRRTGTAERDESDSGTRGLPALSVILVATLLGVGLVWEVANYAEIKGVQLGRFVADQLAYRPGVVVYSERRLHIEASGVAETAFPEPESESAYRFRYTGLKLLFRSNARYFLVPASWSVQEGKTIVLPDNDSVRLEFVRPN